MADIQRREYKIPPAFLVIMDKGYGKDFFENSGLNFEKVLCEIIDNSMDNPIGNQRVKVDLIIEEEKATSGQNNSFRVYIYDDGKGFEN